MNILVFNCGSSSIKYQLFDMPEKKVIAKGLVQRIGEEKSEANQKSDKGEITIEERIADHTAGLQIIEKMLTDGEKGPIGSLDEVKASGHRVVHGGEAFTGSSIIDDEMEKVIEEYFDLAPLHNPANLTGIKEAKKLMPNIPQVGCFDTSFHQSIPKVAYLYALPYELYENNGSTSRRH